jgi:outer membrane protein OmpA-like peptidoglycan-associated protein
MKAGAVWFLGVAALAALSAVAVTQVLPGVQSQLQTAVDTALHRQGLTSVKAKVRGQDVTLTAVDNAPAHLAELAQARAAVAGVVMPGEPVAPHGGALLNRPVARIRLSVARSIVAAAPAATEAASGSVLSRPNASDSGAPEAAPPPVHGDSATAVASASDRPRVAGDEAYEAAAVAATACEDRIQIAVAGRRIAFEPGTYNLTGSGQAVVNDVYQIMQGCAGHPRLTVSAYTDNVGDSLVNQMISQARARAVADALEAKGLAGDRLMVRGYGAALPVADNATADGREKNRRIVFSVTAG